MLDLSPLDMKPYIVLKKSCNVTTNGCLLLPNSGLDLSFKELNSSKIVLRLKKKSGDGNISINNVEYTLKPSGVSEIEIDGKEVSIIRNKVIGDVVLISVGLDTVETRPSMVSILDTWPTLVKKLSPLKGLKLTDSGLFAAECAEISKGNLIEELDTDPPKAYVRKDNVIKFVYPCRVLGIRLIDDPIISEPMAPPLFPHFESQDLRPVVPNQMSIATQISSIKIPEKSKAQSFVFDSGILSTKTIHKHIHVMDAGPSIRMRRLGEFGIVLPKVQSNSIYVFIITLSRINGNGKLEVKLTTTNNDGIRDKKIIISPRNEGDIHVKFATGVVPDPNESYLLHFSRPKDAATGDLLIKRLRVAPGIEMSHIPHIAGATPQAVAQIPPGLTISNSESVMRSWYDYSAPNLDSRIKRMLTHFAILDSENYTATNKVDINGVVKVTDYNSKLWFNRMAPGFSSLEHKSVGVAYHNKPQSTKYENVTLCSLDHLVSGNRIWLRGFDDRRSLTKEQLGVLATAKALLTPSLTNKYKLQTLMPNMNITLCARPWVYIDSTYTRQEYSIYFEEDSKFTKELLKSWNPKFGKLIVCNTAENVSGIAELLHPYTPYPELVKAIVEAKNIIYMSDNIHHQSGLLELAATAGVNILSNNHKYISRGFPLRNNIESSTVLSSDMEKALNKSSKVKLDYRFDLGNYLNFVRQNIGVLLGVPVA